MDPNWAKALVETVRQELSLKRAGRWVRPLGLSVALAVASGAGCGEDEEKPEQDQQEEILPLYGVDMGGGDDSELELMPVYGDPVDLDAADVQDDTELMPVYGDPVDVEDDDSATALYGVDMLPEDSTDAG